MQVGGGKKKKVINLALLAGRDSSIKAAAQGFRRIFNYAFQKRRKAK